MSLSLELLVDDLEARIRAKLAVDSGFTDTERQAHTLKLHFKKFDGDRSGKLNFEEFESALASLNFVGVQDRVKALFQRYDMDGNGLLDYREFAELAVGFRPNPMNSADNRAAIERVRAAVAARGGANGIRTLRHIFKRMDASGNNLLDLGELREGLEDLGVTVSDHDFRTLCRVFDRNGDGLVTFDEFMRAMRGKMNPRRVALVRQAFGIMDATGDGVVTVDDLRARYDVSHVEEVRAGTMTRDQALARFLDQFDRLEKDGVVTFDEFLDYYKDLSAAIADDDYFELMMRNAWRISGGKGAAANTANIRALVTHSDGRQAVYEVRDSLGVQRGDLAQIRRRLESQGVRDIARVSLS